MTLSIVRTEIQPPPTLFGRDAERVLLDRAAARAEAGAGGIVLLRAEHGGGLTRLLSAHADASAARTVVRLRADAAGTGIPYAALGRSVRAGVDGLTPPAEVAADLVRQWACAGPTLVVIDDLHHADGHTVQTLCDLADRLARVPVSVVAGGHSLDGRLAALAERVAVHDLAPLDADAVHAMVADLLGAEPDQALLRRCAGAAGNPWLIARLVASGDRFAEDVVARVDRLGESAATVLRLAAVLVGPTDVAELAAAAGMPVTRVLSIVDRLNRARALDGLTMRHPVVRDALAEASGALFLPVARSLYEAGVAPDRVGAQLAAAPVLDAWAVTWTSGNQLSAGPELLGRVCAALEPGDPRHGDLRAAWAEALLCHGRTDEAAAAARSMLHARPDPAVRSRLRLVLAQVAMMHNDGPGALGELAEETGPGALALTAQAKLLSGDIDGALRCAAGYVGDDPRAEVWLVLVEVVVAYLTRDLDHADALLDRADALLEIAVADRGQWLLAKLMRAAIHDLRRDRRGAEVVAEVLPVADAFAGFFAPWADVITALAAFNDGDWEAALAAAERGIARQDHYGFTRPLHALAGTVLLHRGDVPAGRAHIEAATRAAGQVRGVAAFYEHISAIGDVLLADADGRDDEAAALVRRIADGDAGAHHGNAVTGVAGRLVRIAVRAGDLDLARSLVGAAEAGSVAESAVLRYCHALIESDVDALLVARVDLVEAGWALAAARAGEDAAILLARAGRVDEAKAVFRESVDAYTALSALADLDRAHSALRAAGLRRGVTGRRSAAKRGWDSLTPTELRIAELVAEGCSNPEVARRLVVSPRTVQTHVSRILTKLGRSSRVEIAVELQRRRDVNGNGVR
ncbi:LuxR C-terminal-related transcriptional regulator [Actinokineospora sp. HUAS TT18]|uniref:helix-turn-helix transcriptional regulator n=1 Tax=Actinokineospora sp. HUAS TT18 TaxID=3447451 RepID=UPI003F52661E